MRFVTTFALLAALASIAVASPRANLPVLTAQSDDGSVALAIDAVRIEVLIRGHLARTTFDLTYRNDLSHDLDGEFVFPLPPDAEVSDLGLYFGKRLRHGVAVERVQARRAYEEVVHRRVDPALAEWSPSTRSFRFRVYPIPRNGTKVVHIAYDQELTNAPYELDLRYGKTIALELKIDSDTAVTSDGLVLRRSGSTWSAQGSLLVDGVIRAQRADEETALVAWSASDQMWYASAPARIRSGAPAAAPAPHVTLLYDVSSSAAKREEAKVVEFLRAFVGRQRGGAMVMVVPFHHGIERPLMTNAAGLEPMLASLSTAGATDLAGVLERLSFNAASAPADSRLMLVTDGVNTLGDSARLSRALAGIAKLGRPLTIVNASPEADDITLGAIARSTGGWQLDLTQTAVADAVEMAMRVPTRMVLRSAELPARDVVPSSMLATVDAYTTLNARSRDRLTFLSVITGTTRHDMPVREIDADDLVRRAWARARLRELLANGASAEAVLEHGKHFNQLTPRTSLLVLDSWRDYEFYGIPMPPDVREQREADLAAVASLSVRLIGAVSSIVLRGTTAERPPVHGAWVLRVVVGDSDGIPIPGATVTLRTGSDQVLTAISDDKGQLWISLPRAPASFTLTGDLPGFIPVQQLFPQGAQSGSVVEIRLAIGVVSEAITVTAEAPIIGKPLAVLGVSIPPTPAAIADQLLNALANDDAPLLSEEETQASVEQRLARIAAVVEKLRSLPIEGDRFRYYVAARSVLGGDKLFQAEAALALRADSPELALRALTDLAEAYPDDAPTLRIVGRVLDGWGRGDLARLMFERALEIAPDEAQTKRELQFLGAKEGAGGTDPRRIPAAELQVEMMWDLSYTDVDLHVIEPSGEEVMYDHKQSKAGGLLHEDITTGFGPETYTLARMDRGRYQIALSYYSGDDSRLSLQTLAHVIVYVRGERHDYFVALAGEKERQVVAEVTR